MTKQDLRLHELLSEAEACRLLAAGATARGLNAEAAGWRYKAQEAEAAAQRLSEAAGIDTRMVRGSDLYPEDYVFPWETEAQ